MNNGAVLTDPTASSEISRGRIPVLETESVETVFRVSLLGPTLVVQGCLKRRASGAVVLNISSKPTIGPNQTGTLHAYGPSKAALTRWTWEAAPELAAQGVTMAAVYPGWVRTEMVGPSGDVDADEAARDFLTLAAPLTVRDAGRYVDRFGRDCAAPPITGPWSLTENFDGLNRAHQLGIENCLLVVCGVINLDDTLANHLIAQRQPARGLGFFKDVRRGEHTLQIVLALLEINAELQSST